MYVSYLDHAIHKLLALLVINVQVLCSEVRGKEVTECGHLWLHCTLVRVLAGERWQKQYGCGDHESLQVGMHQLASGHHNASFEWMAWYHGRVCVIYSN